MNLQVWIAAHKAAAAGVGAAGAVGLGLYAKKRKGSGAAAGKTVIQPAATGPSSTSSDLYNSMEPIWEDLYRQVAALRQQASTPQTALTPTPPPVPAPTDPVAFPGSSPVVTGGAGLQLSNPNGPDLATVINSTGQWGTPSRPYIVANGSGLFTGLPGSALTPDQLAPYGGIDPGTSYVVGYNGAAIPAAAFPTSSASKPWG